MRWVWLVALLVAEARGADYNIDLVLTNSNTSNPVWVWSETELHLRTNDRAFISFSQTPEYSGRLELAMEQIPVTCSGVEQRFFNYSDPWTKQESFAITYVKPVQFHYVYARRVTGDNITQTCNDQHPYAMIKFYDETIPKNYDGFWFIFVDQNNLNRWEPPKSPTRPRRFQTGQTVALEVSQYSHYFNNYDVEYAVVNSEKNCTELDANNDWVAIGNDWVERPDNQNYVMTVYITFEEPLYPLGEYWAYFRLSLPGWTDDQINFASACKTGTKYYDPDSVLHLNVLETLPEPTDYLDATTEDYTSTSTTTTTTTTTITTTPKPTTTTTTTTPEADDGLSTGAIAGIAVGSGLAVVLLVVFIVYAARRAKSPSGYAKVDTAWISNN